MTNCDLINGKISDRKLKTAQGNGFMFNQINNIRIKTYTSP